MGLFSIFKESSVLYFPGCVTYFKFKDNFELYKKIFSKLGIDFKVIEKKVCCGIPALEIGYVPEARKLARRNFEIFKEEEITSIITNSPCCYKMFLYDYKEILPDWNIETKNIWKIILTKLQEKPSLIRNKENGEIAYQDSCYLGRYSGIYDEPREILKIIGYDLKEIPEFKSESVCSGSCGSLTITNPKLADDIAKERILQAKRAGIKKIAVASLNDYELLKKNSEGTGVEILELGEILAIALGIKRKEHEKNSQGQIISEAGANLKIQEELEDENSS